MKKIRGLISIICLMVIGLFFVGNINDAKAASKPEVSIEVDNANALPGSIITVTSRVHMDETFIGQKMNSLTIMYYAFNIDNFTLVGLKSNNTVNRQNIKYDSVTYSAYDVSCKTELVDYYEDCMYIEINMLSPFDDDELVSYNGEDITFSLEFEVAETPANTDPIKFYQDPLDLPVVIINDVNYCYDDALGIFDLGFEEITSEVTITQPNSTTALESLTVGETTYSGADIANVLTNGIEVEADVESLAVSAVVADNGTVTSITGPKGTGSPVTLNEPGEETTIDILATAENKTDTETHSIKITRKKYDVNTLDSLEISLPSGTEGKVTLSPGFDKDTNDYDLSIPEGATSLIIKPTVTADVYIQGVTINGNEAVSGANNTVDISTLSEGDVIEIVVTAQNGEENTYTLTLDKLSDDTDLKNGVSGNYLNNTTTGESIDFDVTDDAYTATVAYTGVTGFKIDAEANDANATISFSPASKQANFSGFAETSQTITITVTSESGIERTYTVTVTRQKANEDTGFTLTVTGDKTDTEFSKSAASTETLYIYEVPESEETVTLSYEANTETTTFELVGTPSIGGADVTLKIIPENTDKTKTITISIRKTKETDNEIKSLEMLDKENGTTLADKNGNTLVFDKEQPEYEFTFAYSVESVYIKATCADSADLMGTGIGKIDLEPGTVTYTVYARSESDVDGDKYYIKITREDADHNADLTKLTINGDEITGYEPNKTLKLRYDRDVTTLNLVAEISDNASISGDMTSLTGEITLTPGGTETISITVTAQDGETKNIYKFEIACKEDINEITNVTISDVEYTFEKQTEDKGYEFEVGYETTKVDLDVTKSGEYSVLTVKLNGRTADIGELALSEGDNTIVVYVTSEYGTKGVTYTYTIKREAADDGADLTKLTINGDEITGYEPNKTLKLRYDRDVTTLNLVVEISEHASISGNMTSLTEEITLTPGETRTITITVTAQDGETKNTYKFEIACKEDINEITNVTISDVEYTFEKQTEDKGYEFEVGYETTKVDLDVTKSGEYSVLTVKLNGRTADIGELALSEGDNTIVVYVTSEYGTKGVTYTYTITRGEADDDATLSDLQFIVDGENLLEDFESNSDKRYQITIPSDETATSGMFIATTSSDKATIETDLSQAIVFQGVASQTITITVKAQNGRDTKSYIVSIVNEGEELSSNVDILDITITDENGDDYIGFDKDDPDYEIELPYNIGSLLITIITPEGANSTKVGEGPISIAQGEELEDIFLYVIAQNTVDESTRYKVKIKRAEAEHVAQLTDITINGVSLPDFNPTKYIYEYRVEHDVREVLIGATAYETASIVSTLGSKNLVLGPNEATIVVLAQDGVLTQPYTINIVRAEDKYTIEDIDFSDIEYTFDAGSTSESFDVAYSVNIIDITVLTDGDYTNVVVEVNGRVQTQGIAALNVGTNNIKIYAKSEFGTIGTEYNYTINRAEADDNNYLSNLEVYVGGVNMIVDFDKEDTSYEIENIADDITSVRIVATPESNLATVSGTGNILLNNAVVQGNTMILTVEVTAENGDKLPYIIYVSRDSIDLDENNDIVNIVIYGTDGTTYFNEFDQQGDIIIVAGLPYNVTGIVISVTTPQGASSTITGAGLHSFTSNVIEVEVYATSTAGNKGTVYTVRVERNVPDSNAALEFIKIDGGLITGFASDDYQYDLRVNNSVSTVDITYKAFSPSTTVELIIRGNAHSGMGIQLLEGTQNIISIVATAQDGTRVAYTVTIVRAAKDGVLSMLYIDGIQFHEQGKPNNYVYYDESIDTYYATVANSYYSINIIAAALDTTVEIRGAGIKDLEVGYNEFQVAAIPSTGNVAIYNIIVIRKAGINGITNVQSITINEIESFGTSYSNEIDLYLEEYDFRVNSNIKQLTFNVDFGTQEFEETAKYEIIGNQLTYGKNTIIIKITASDTITIRYIVIIVIREQVKINEAKISEIESFTTDFNENENSYSYKVGKDVTTLDIKFDVEEGVTYEIKNNELEEGSNVIEIVFKNGDEVARIVKINVFRDINTAPNLGFLAAVCGSAALVLIIVFAFMIRKKKKRGK